jgi:hypothetical protein
MRERSEFRLQPFEDLQDIKGIAFPASLKFRQLLVTGPPGCGKTRLINKIGGWPEEGFIDLTLENWWRAQSLTYRPREVHLGIPFKGQTEALTIFDDAWLAGMDQLEIDFGRIHLPPAKAHFLGTDWRKRFMFEFLLPPAEKILQWRLARSKCSAHPVDKGVNLAQIERQLAVYRAIALHFQESEILIYIREGIEAVPHYIETAKMRENEAENV